MNLYLIHGQDTYRSLERVGELKKKFLENHRSSDIASVEGDDVDFDMLEMALLSSGSLFAQEQLVVIKDLLKSKSLFQVEQRLLLLLDSATKKSGGNTVIFYERGEADKRTAIYKKLKSVCREEVFSLLDERMVLSWVRQYVKTKSVFIEHDACSLLVELIGNDLWRMRTETDKLIAYSGDGSITRGAVISLVAPRYETNIFAMIDAVAFKNKRRAYKLLHDQLANGAEPLYILAMLARQFRILALVRDFLEQSPSGRHGDIASSLKLHPFVASKALDSARFFDFKKIRLLYEFLCRIDMRLKTSKISPKVLLELFFAEAVS